MMANAITVLFLKASLGRGERWITLHPNGRDEKGVPVLIRQEPDGAAKVVGGAGGKLNHLRLTGVRSEADYKAEAGERAKARKDEAKRRAASDKEHGLTESKGKAREALRAEVGQHEATFVQTVADAIGWKPEDMRFPEEAFQNATPAARKKAEANHARDLFRRARDAVKHQREHLIADAEARAEAGIGEVRLTTADPAELSVADLDDAAPAGAGLGFEPDYGARAAERGLNADELKDEAAASKPPPAGADENGETPADRRKRLSASIAEELKAIREPGPKVDPNALVDAKKAVELLKAEKALRAVRQNAKEKKRLIDKADAPVEPKAYVLETGGPTDEAITKDIESDLRTLRTRAFLDEVGKLGAVPSLGRHIGVGAFNSINALALATGGASLVDRSVVDVLGIAGASQVLAKRLHTDLTAEELGHVRDAMGAFHVDHYMKLSDQALREARDWKDMAHEVEVGEGSDGAELAVAQELNAKRREFVENATRTLGTAVGEMEANAALVVALEQPAKKQVQASLGKTSIEDAIKQVRAIGLDRGDYSIEKIGASTMLTVKESGMGKLAAPVSRADLAHVQGALDIINGLHDEADWLPGGVTKRPDLGLEAKPGVAPQLAKPFAKSPGDRMAGAISDFIGGRAADGQAPADIMADLLSENTLQRAGDRTAFMRELNAVAPLYDSDGKMVRAEAYQGAFEKMAEDYVDKLGGNLSPIHRQKFEIDAASADALHRALAEHPEGVAAFKPIGEMTPQDQRALRDTFAKQYGRSDPEAEAMRVKLEALDAKPPEREVDDMFGRGINPEWTAWKNERDALAEKLNASSMTWGKYLSVMGSPANAYRAMQDVVRGNVLAKFAEVHNTLSPKTPLKVGKTVIAHDLAHLDALDPVARDKRLAQQRELANNLRNRVGGKYAAGGIADKMDAARAAEEASSQAQLGMFGMDDLLGADSGDAAPAANPIQLGERTSIGHAAERQVAAMMPVVGANFRPGDHPEMWKPTMSGRFVQRQRAVKLIEHNKRLGAALGVGSGKTSIMLGGLTNLITKGMAKRGLFLVPSVVQGQFHAEALTTLEPGKFKWHADPGASREQRIAAYKDPATHFSVVTHQAFRDDMLHLAAQQAGTTPDAVATRLDAMKPAERAAFMKETMAKEGIDHDYLAVDEGHNLLNRAGKANSHMANVVDAVSSNLPYYVNATADPVKNDPSEAYDVLAKMDPARYPDRAAFMRKYGVDTPSAKDALQREMARYVYTGRVDPGVSAEKREVSVKLSADQRAQISALDAAAGKAKLARMRGEVDVDAIRALSPGSFEGVDPVQHHEIASGLSRSLGIIRDSAIKHAIDGGAKTDKVAELAKERAGKPGVVFARRRDRVDEIAARLKADGHRVVTVTGGDTAKQKSEKLKAYQAGEHDVMVASDAAAVGANLQRGQWLAQYDSPVTAMLHAQRQGRINRFGQKNNVELLDLVADHPAERAARKRLTDKYELRDIMTSPMEGMDDRGIAGYLQRAKAGKLEAEQPMHMPVPEHERPSEPEADDQGALSLAA